MSIKNKLQDIYNQLFVLLSQFKQINVANFISLPNQINNCVVGENKIKSLLNKSIQEVTKDDLNGITSIAKYAFRNCTSLTNVTIPDSVTSIGDDAFWGCTSLTNITLPFIGKSANDLQGFTYFGYIFGASSYQSNGSYVPSSLKKVIIGNICRRIALNAFSRCDNIEEVEIGSGIMSIDANAFSGCTSLTNIYLNQTTPPSLGNTSAIPTTTTIHIPIGSGDAYKTATNWSYHSSRIVEDIEI